MIFENIEVVELGLVEELILDIFDLCNTEGTTPSRMKSELPMYVADAA